MATLLLWGRVAVLGLSRVVIIRISPFSFAFSLFPNDLRSGLAGFFASRPSCLDGRRVSDGMCNGGPMGEVIVV